MVLVAALGLLALASAVLDVLAPVAIGLDLVLLVALTVDLVRTPRPSKLELRRTVPERVGLSTDFTRRLHVVPGPAAGLELEVREEFAPSFEVRARGVEAGGRGAGEAVAPPEQGDPTGGPDRVRLPSGSGGEVSVPRVYAARLRGVHSLGDVRLRLRSPLGLLWRQARLRSVQSIQVVPALVGLGRTLELAASERWQDLGVRRVRRRGGMTDFESLRDYVHGDDVRLVDWKAFARRGKPAVRQFQVERGQELILVVDCGRRMAVTTEEGRSRGWSKLDHALDAALQLAAVAIQEGDHVGLLAFDSQVRTWIPPRRGSRVLPRLIEAVFGLEARLVESDLARALREVALRHRRRALVMVLSDVADPLSVAHQREALRQGGRTHALVFAALDDPGLLAAAEGRGEGTGEGAALRAAALDLVHERRTSVAQLGGPGVRVLDTLPGEAAGPLLAAWLDARRSGVAAR